jgi:hypothetical protein
MIKTINYPFTAILLIFITIGSSCNRVKYPYCPENFYARERLDSLLIEMVTIMGKRPKSIDKAASMLPEYRSYYEKLAREYELRFLFIGNDSVHYFYIIRPARNHTGNVNRAAGGYFSLDSTGQIVRFVEVFNTTILPVDELTEKGIPLFRMMIKTGNIDPFLRDRKLIEWPSETSHYDQELNEWVSNE